MEGCRHPVPWTLIYAPMDQQMSLCAFVFVRLCCSIQTLCVLLIGGSESTICIGGVVPLLLPVYLWCPIVVSVRTVDGVEGVQQFTPQETKSADTPLRYTGLTLTGIGARMSKKLRCQIPSM